MLQGRNFTVAGGGIAGLTTSLALGRRQADVVLLEKAQTFGEVGAGLQITPNGMSVLDDLGVGEALRDVSVAPTVVELRDYATAKLVASVDLTPFAKHSNYLLVHRADLVEVLVSAVRQAGVAIRRGVEVLGVDDTPEGVTLELKGRNPQTADFVVGADGLHSVLYSSLNSDEKPFFTEQVAWRALIEGNFARRSVQVFMGPKKHVVVYPLRGGKLLNLVCIEEREDWVEEGWSTAGAPDDLRNRFAEFGGPVRDYLADVKSCLIWGLFRHKVARTWHGHNTALVGDAVHPTLPFLAQGANMALEDAAILADRLANHETAAALADYQATRSPRVQKIIGVSNRNAKNFHMSPGAGRFLAHFGLKVASRIMPGRLNRRFDWVYRYDATTA